MDIHLFPIITGQHIKEIPPSVHTLAVFGVVSSVIPENVPRVYLHLGPNGSTISLYKVPANIEILALAADSDPDFEHVYTLFENRHTQVEVLIVDPNVCIDQSIRCSILVSIGGNIKHYWSTGAHTVVFVNDPYYPEVWDQEVSGIPPSVTHVVIGDYEDFNLDWLPDTVTHYSVASADTEVVGKCRAELCPLSLPKDYNQILIEPWCWARFWDTGTSH